MEFQSLVIVYGTHLHETILWCGSVENQGPKKGREQMILNKSSRDIVHHHKQVQQQSHFHTCLSYLDFCDHIKHITGA